jgi:hypothetical protein
MTIVLLHGQQMKISLSTMRSNPNLFIIVPYKIQSLLKDAKITPVVG